MMMNLTMEWKESPSESASRQESGCGGPSSHRTTVYTQWCCPFGTRESIPPSVLWWNGEPIWETADFDRECSACSQSLKTPRDGSEQELNVTL